MALKDWFRILNWKDLPSFGDVHILTKGSDFKNNYFLDPRLDDLISDLLVGLRGEFYPQSSRIIGAPGVGKTSFIYYLIKLVKDNFPEIDKKYEFYVLHVLRVIQDSILTEELIARIYEAVVNFYESNGITKEILADIEDNEELSLKSKINKLLDYYLKNKIQFKKRLIFIMDGVDLIDFNLVMPLIKEMRNHLEPHSIIKWITIRNTTYNLYDEQTLSIINTCFAEPFTFPVVRLHDIIQQRIDSVGVKGKTPINPFSEPLCAEVQNVLNFDHRQGLGLLKKILEENPPKDIKVGTDVKFIWLYINRVAMRTFINNNIILNIFDTRITGNVMFPLEKELICVLRHRQIIDELCIGIIEEEINSRIRMLKGKESNKIRIRKEDFEAAVDILLRHAIIQKKAKKVYFLTNRGHSLSKIVNKDYYIELCLTLLKQQGVTLNNLYRDLIGIEAHYEEIILQEYLKNI